MAQGEGFKHITVTAADEDDVVIMAGTSGESGIQSDTTAPDSPPSSAPGPAARFRPEAAQPSPCPAAEPDAAHDAYRETTLKDLEGGSMPLAQRIVIIAAIVCIIGAVIYYFAFMG